MATIASSRNAVRALDRSWQRIVDEARQVRGDPAHYRALVYHGLRVDGGVPLRQIGLGVEQWIAAPSTPFLRDLAASLAAGPAAADGGGIDLLADIAMFRSRINGDWRRRNHGASLLLMVMAIAVRSLARRGARLSAAELDRDIASLAAQRVEVSNAGGDFQPVLMILDVATDEAERVPSQILAGARRAAKTHRVAFYYASHTEDFVDPV